MAATDRRRFTIADAMILIAATAVGMLMLRESLPGFYRVQGLRRAAYPVSTPGVEILSWASGPISCLVVAWMGGLVVVRLRPPRPRFRLLVRQPGFAACLVAGTALVPGLVHSLSLAIFRASLLLRIGFDVVRSNALEWVPRAVLGCWLALALAGLWRPDPSWVDRLGRLLGGYWVVVLVLTFLDFWAALLLRSLGR